jgi:hypothetical protein
MTKKQLAILYGIIFSVNSLSLSAIAAFEHVSFSELGKEDWMLIVLAIIGSWTTTMLAFVSTAMHNMTPTTPLPQAPAKAPQYAANPESGGMISPK